MSLKMLFLMHLQLLLQLIVIFKVDYFTVYLIKYHKKVQNAYHNFKKSKVTYLLLVLCH